jgi:hypothetical protein
LSYGVSILTEKTLLLYALGPSVVEVFFSCQQKSFNPLHLFGKALGIEQLPKRHATAEEQLQRGADDTACMI